MAKRIAWLTLSCILVIGMLAASCSNKGTTQQTTTVTGSVATTTSSTVTTQPTTTAATTTTPPTSASATPQYGGRIKVSDMLAATEPQSWDPHDLIWSTGGYAGVYMETLMTGDLSKGPRGTNEFPFFDYEFIPKQYLKGSLAESWEITNIEGTVYTFVFHLRKGVVWPEKQGVMASRPLVADDVVFAFNRFYNDSPFAGFTAKEVRVTALDKNTVCITTDNYVPDWDQLFGWRWITPMVYPPELVKAGISDWKNATGTGPFLLENYVQGTQVTYKKNPDYWGKSVINGKEYQLPFVDGLDVVIIPEEMTRMAAMRTGKIDMMEPIMAKAAIDLKKSNPELLFTAGVGASSETLVMRFDQKPTSDIRVRQAMMMSLDMKAICDSVYSGEGELTAFPWHPDWGSAIYTPLEEMSATVQKMFLGPRDVAQAKQLLKDAGYPNGFKLRLLTETPGGGGGAEDIVAMIQAYWADVGITLDVMQKDSATLQSMQSAKDYDIMISSRNAVPPGTGVGDYSKPDYLWNTCQMNDDRLNAIVEEIRYSTDLAFINADLKEAGIRFKELVAYCGFGAVKAYSFWEPWVKNYYGERNTGYMNPSQIWSNLWIDAAARKKAVGR